MTNIDGKLYIRPHAESFTGADAGVVYNEESFTSTPPTYESFSLPRWLVTTTDTRILDLKNLLDVSSPVIATGTKLFFDTKTTLNGEVYATTGEPAEGEYPGVNISHTRSIESRDFSSMKYHRAYTLLEDAQKTDLSTGQTIAGSSIETGRAVYFQSAISLGGTMYLRSAKDTTEDAVTVIPLDILSPVEVTFLPMEEPRRLRVGVTTRKYDPVTLQKVDAILERGSTAIFSEKISIGGKLYLRTTVDTQRGHYKVVPFSDLTEL
jgi:hypothetical protein